MKNDTVKFNFQKAEIFICDMEEDVKFPHVYLDDKNRWNGWSNPYLPIEKAEEFIKIWNDAQCIKEGDEWSMNLIKEENKIIGIEYIWEKQYALTNLEDGQCSEVSEVQKITLPNSEQIDVIYIGFGLIWEHKILDVKNALMTNTNQMLGILDNIQNKEQNLVFRVDENLKSTLENIIESQMSLVVQSIEDELSFNDIELQSLGSLHDALKDKEEQILEIILKHI